MNTLDRICADKRAHVEMCKSRIPITALKQKILTLSPPRGFINTLRKSSSGLIAEVKKASPSRGIIRADFDPAQIAKTYAESGAACLSVLTDTPYFQGCDDDLETVRRAVGIPVLRKDFMLAPYQIVESRAMGADCVLIIMAALTDFDANELYTTAESLGLDVLVEVHDEEELDRALRLSPRMVGINSRNLKTFAVDLETARFLAPKIPDGVLKVAESGIETASDIAGLREAGFEAFLVGESLLRHADIGAAVQNLLGKGIDTKSEPK